MHKIIETVYAEPTNSLRAAVNKLKAADPMLFKGLNESTLRGWFRRTDDTGIAAPFKLKDQAQIKMKKSFSCRGGRSQSTLGIFKEAGIPFSWL